MTVGQPNRSLVRRCCFLWTAVLVAVLIMLAFGGSALQWWGSALLFAAYTAAALTLARRRWWLIALAVVWGLSYPYWQPQSLSLAGWLGERLWNPEQEPGNPTLRFLWEHAFPLLTCALCGAATAIVLWAATRSTAIAVCTFVASLALEPILFGPFYDSVWTWSGGLTVSDKTYGVFQVTAPALAYSLWHLAVSGSLLYWAVGGRWRWRRRGCCANCGYDLAGLPTSAICPECGAGAKA